MRPKMQDEGEESQKAGEECEEAAAGTHRSDAEASQVLDGSSHGSESLESRKEVSAIMHEGDSPVANEAESAQERRSSPAKLEVQQSPKGKDMLEQREIALAKANASGPSFLGSEMTPPGSLAGGSGTQSPARAASQQSGLREAAQSKETPPTGPGSEEFPLCATDQDDYQLQLDDESEGQDFGSADGFEESILEANGNELRLAEDDGKREDSEDGLSVNSDLRQTAVSGRPSQGPIPGHAKGGAITDETGPAEVRKSRWKNFLACLRSLLAKSISIGFTTLLLLGIAPSKSNKTVARSVAVKVLGCCSSKTLGSKETYSDDEDEGDSDSSDDSLDDRRTLRAKLKASRTKSFGEEALETLEQRAMESLGIPEFQDEWTKKEYHEHWSWGVRCQSALGILALRVKIAKQQIRSDEETPAYPILKKIVHSLRFDCVFGACIGLNSIVSGADAMYGKGEERSIVITLGENLFVFIFVLEWCLRITADTWVWVFHPMNCFDTFVVWVTGVLVLWILEPVGLEINLLRRLGTLRVLRLARLARAVRTRGFFKELWMLVSGMMECTRLLFWSFVIIGTVHFVFAVAIMETITKSELFQDDEVVLYRFGDLLITMFTLFQLMTFDNWASFVRPIMYKAPETGLIFFAFMGIAGIVLVNLMTAVVVKQAFDSQEQDEEAAALLKVEEQAKQHGELMEMFYSLDEDGSGDLSREEFTDVLDDVLFIRQMKTLDIDLEELPDIFDILDDGDGKVTNEEFVNGLMRLQGVAMSREMLKCACKNKQLNSTFGLVTETMGHKVDHTLLLVEGSMEHSHEAMVEIQQMTAEIMKKIEQIGLQRQVNFTTSAVPAVVPPTLEEAVVKEAEADAGEEVGVDQIKKKGFKVKAKYRLAEAPALAGAHLKSMPASFVLKRKKYILEKKKAIRKAEEEQKRIDAGLALEEKVVQVAVVEGDRVPGVPTEFNKTWNGMQVNIPNASVTERLAFKEQLKKETITNGGADKNKPALHLPATLPVSLAPRGLLPAVSKPSTSPAPKSTVEKPKTPPVAKDGDKDKSKSKSKTPPSEGSQTTLF
ncbi:unnamed protein product [Polarella glacialis]|uniref:EF-hand domain-containing protein n=1 Tax=Polarella glacialis TaxID=89957 RepID=A0A813EYX5_POLGL|nr:unnamed protein product [Polarella glacialis]